MINFKYPIFNPSRAINVWLDWDLPADRFTHDLDLVLSQPFKVAAMPVMATVPTEFSFDPKTQNVDYSKFDLVILTDVEFRSIKSIRSWANDLGIQNYILALGALPAGETLDDNMVYRPHWMYNLLRLNQYTDTNCRSKPFLFDALLGARRPHRDYVMLALGASNLLDKSIATYRDLFAGHVVDNFNQLAAAAFPGQRLTWPYVSPNLKPEWEVNGQLGPHISSQIPVDIYRNTWYSIVCETLGVGYDMFFLSEKTSKAMFAQRITVTFACADFLKNLRLLGFETFDNIIDESYDSMRWDLERYKLAFDQVVALSKTNPASVYEYCRPRLKHNQQRCYSLQKETDASMRQLLLDRLPSYSIDQ